MRPMCAVCGQNGYWVTWSQRHQDYLCLNHIGGGSVAAEHAAWLVWHQEVTGG